MAQRRHQASTCNDPAWRQTAWPHLWSVDHRIQAPQSRVHRAASANQSHSTGKTPDCSGPSASISTLLTCPISRIRKILRIGKYSKSAWVRKLGKNGVVGPLEYFMDWLELFRI